MAYTIETIYHKGWSKTPAWAKGIIASFGSIPESMTKDEAMAMLASLLNFITNTYRYKRRNSMEHMNIHPMNIRSESITIYSIQAKEVVTYKIKEYDKDIETTH